jgi:gliding motility-associated protein GldM
MSLPREPRQKMINMMYLVLTALLALNVSSEILNAFKTVNRSLETTNTTVNNSTGTIMASLLEKTTTAETKERAAIWYPKAKNVQTYSEGLYTYIQGLKDKILKEAGGDPNNPNKSFKEDNLDIATRLMVDKGEGKKLYAMLEEYKKNVLAVDPAVTKAFENSLQIDLTKPPTKNKGNNTWEAAYFRMVPTVAAMTILSKFQNDVRTTENKVISFCHEQVGKVTVVFNAYEPIVGQNAKVLLAGQDLEISAGLAAFNTEKLPEVYINGARVQTNDKGLAIWKNAVSSTGKIPVLIKFTDQNGAPQEKKIDVEYQVGQSNAAVQLDKMNVLFIGVDNPVTVSGSGSVSELKVNMSGVQGSLTPAGNGQYIARVNNETDDAVITVVTPDGKSNPKKFRVRSIPDPTPRVGGRESGDVPAGEFKSQGGVNAIVKNFFYETQFTVTGFRITFDGAGFEEGIDEKINSGAAWNEARAAIGKCRPGTYITIDDIRAVGPDKRTRKLTPLIFTLK